MSDPMTIYAVGALGQPIRLFIENASRISLVLAQLQPGEDAFPVADRTARNVTVADVASALQGPA